MKQKSRLDDEYKSESLEMSLSRMFLSPSYTPIKTRKHSGILLLCCFILITNFTQAKQINHNISFGTQYRKQNNLSGPNQVQCLIGLEIESLDKDANSLLLPTATIIEFSQKDVMKAQQPNRWRYCVIRQRQQLLRGESTRFSRDWQQCLQACCATIFSDQCYFKASFINIQPVNKFNLSPNLRNHFTPTNNDNVNIDAIISDKMRLLQGDSNSNGDGSVANGGQIVLIVITCIFGVPLLLLIIFAIISIVKLCMLRSMQNAENIAGSGQQGTTDIITEEVHLDEYKMQQMGPYHVNFHQQCPICLDEKVNLRTRCGHFYHPQCIKAWIIRGRSRCPVCNCTRLNPMKVYCRKCYVGVKLVVLDSKMDDKVVGEIALLECENCGEEDVSVGLSPIPAEGVDKQGVKKNGNQANKKGDVSAIAKYKSAQRVRHHPRISKVSQPRQSQQLNPSSSSSSNQQQAHRIAVRNISQEHNQNQLMQQLALRASAHHFLGQGPGI